MPVPLSSRFVAALATTIATSNALTIQQSIPVSITPSMSTMPVASYLSYNFAHPSVKTKCVNALSTGGSAHVTDQDNNEGDGSQELTIDSVQASNIGSDAHAGEVGGDVGPTKKQSSSSNPSIARPNSKKASVTKVCDRCKTTIGKPADKVLSQRAAEQPAVASSRDGRKSVNDDSWEIVKKVGMGYACCVCGLLLFSAAGIAYSEIQKARREDREKASKQGDVEMAQEGEEQKKHKKGN